MGSPSQATLKIVRPPFLPIFGRLAALSLALIVCSTVAFTAWARGLTWIYDSDNGGNLVLLTCPKEIYTFSGFIPQGEFCQLSMKRHQDLVDLINGHGFFGGGNSFHCIRPTNGEDPIICNMRQVCGDVCLMQDGSGICKSAGQLPPQPVGKPEPQCIVTVGFDRGGGSPVNYVMDCRKVQYGSYCDTAFNVTSSNTIAIRGILAGSALISIIWFLAELVLRSVDIDLRMEKAIGMARMAQELPEKKAILRKSLEEKWRHGSPIPLNYSNSRMDSFTGSEADPAWWGNSATPTDGSRSPGTAHPMRLFTSSSWRRRLDQWQKLRVEKGHHFQTKLFLRTLLLNLFFLTLLVGTFYIIILISPQNISTEEGWDESLIGKVKVHNLQTWVDYLIFADVLVDTVLFLIAIVAVKWPAAPVFSRHIQEQIQAVTEKAADISTQDMDEIYDEGALARHHRDDEGLDYSVSDCASVATSGSVSFILDQSMSNDTCLMIACHCSTMTVERCETFSNTLRAALDVFPPSHIFVCDNGPTIHPQDETQFVAKQVHPDINYLYVPEGNKTFAFYWCNKHWIPFLAKCGVVPNFIFTVIIDDDVPLPNDLHIPHEHLKKDLTIKAVHFPITATTPDGKPPTLVGCQDIEYKLAAVHKLFQATMCRSLSCHGAIALWDREAMGEVFQEHDTVFNGEDLYMGLCLLRKRDNSKIISCAQTIVPTYAPDSWAVLFRQRVKSWELTSHKKTFTFLVEILNPLSFFHLASLCLKPYFIQETLTILLDWVRVFLLMGLFLRDTLGLLLMTVFFTSVQYFQLLLFQFVVLRERKNLRSSAKTVIVFPFYKLCNLVFRVCALCQNMLVYSHERKGIKIAVREDEIRDVPPLPPHYLVDWFTIWDKPETPVEPSGSKMYRSKSSASNVWNRFRN